MWLYNSRNLWWYNQLVQPDVMLRYAPHDAGSGKPIQPITFPDVGMFWLALLPGHDHCCSLAVQHG